jgi:quinoprotein glucose dehydrogenase
MIKKITIWISSLLAFAVLYFYLSISIINRCKTTLIFKSVMDFGISHLDICYSKKYLKPKIKSILKNSPTLYAIARKVRRSGKDSFQWDSSASIKQIEYAKKQTEISKNLDTPFIKGLINKNFDTTNVKSNYFKFENWNRSHGDHANTKFHPSKQINKDNIKNLKLAWKYQSIKSEDLEKKFVRNVESNPVFIDGKIISTTPDWRIVANDAITGKVIWDLQSIFQTGRRGMVSYSDPITGNDYLIAPIQGKIYKINVKNGKLEKNFGKKGVIKNAYTLVAPLIYKNKLVIVGTNKITVFNLINGKRLNKYSLRHEDRNFSRGAIWGGAALDKEKGIVYATTGNPQPGIYGVQRPGDNKNSSSVLAFDLNKGKLLWSFQETKHDLWDFDLSSPAIIHNLKIDDKIYEVVIALSKTGNALILERNTGNPIFDINYKKAPISDLPGEFANPFQIYLEKPERFSEIEYGLDSFNKLSKEKISEINLKLKNAKFGWFETPSFNKDLITFGLHGGAQWMGASLDPINQYLYLPVNNVPWTIRPYLQSAEVKTFFSKDAHELYLNKCSSCHGKFRNGTYKKIKEKWATNIIPNLVGYYTNLGVENKLTSLDEMNKKHENLNLNLNELNSIKSLFKEWDKVLYEKNEIKVEGNGMAWSQFLTSDNLPASNPPWGYIAKLDLKDGKIIWKAAHGDITVDGKSVKVGTVNFGGTALNGAGILFYTGTDDEKAYAIDAESGKELWSFQMEAAGSAPPTIFELEGKQYVTFTATGGNYHHYRNRSSTLYTFSVD